ncbi:MAG: ECF-type sigma factor [Proteobacteria bacterium]|nr:ECF-type sigma factor [Pseudomonadota bacterium]
MSKTAKQEITELLKDLDKDDHASQEEIMKILYQELHTIAANLISREHHGITYKATELVNEAYLRLFDSKQLNWNDRKHFLSSSVIVMRRFLVDHARKKAAKRRIPQNVQYTFDDVLENTDSQEIDIIKLDDALTELERLDPKQAKIVGLRFFVGLTDKEISKLFDVSRASINLEWQTAKLWLLQEMQS